MTGAPCHAHGRGRLASVIRPLFHCLIIASLLSLGATLWQLELMRIPPVRSWSVMTLSIGICCVGTIAVAMAWRVSLHQVGVETTRSVCVAAVGLSIFGKYMPGKVWAIVGQAGYTSSMTRRSVGELSGTSLSLQLVAVWVGLGMGVAGVALVGGAQRLLLFSVSAWLVLGAILVLSPTESWLARMVRRLGLPVPRLRLLPISGVLRVFPWLLVTWFAWSLAFYLMVRGLLADPTPWPVALAFPLAASLGIIAIVFPAGLGVREGVLTAYLSLCGMSLPEATGVAVAARLLFMLGEVLTFGCGLIAHFVWNVRHSKTTVSNEFDAVSER